MLTNERFTELLDAVGGSSMQNREGESPPSTLFYC